MSNEQEQVFNISYPYDIPKVSRALHMNNGFGRRVFDDWRFVGVFTAFSGAPYSPSFSIQQANSTTSVNLGNIFLGTGDLTPRLQVTGSPNSASAGTVFNASALGHSRARIDGTGPRNFLNGLGSFANDMSLVKPIRVHEKYGFELRVNAFNPFNQGAADQHQQHHSVQGQRPDLRERIHHHQYRRRNWRPTRLPRASLRSRARSMARALRR